LILPATESEIAVPLGKPQIGIYYAEIKPSMSPTELLLNLCESKNIFVPWSVVEESIKNTNKATLTRASSVMNSIDNFGYAAEATSSPRQSNYFVTKTALLDLLTYIGMKKKGNTHTAIQRK
jgi:hypothetical protein